MRKLSPLNPAIDVGINHTCINKWERRVLNPQCGSSRREELKHKGLESGMCSMCSCLWQGYACFRLEKSSWHAISVYVCFLWCHFSPMKNFCWHFSLFMIVTDGFFCFVWKCTCFPLITWRYFCWVWTQLTTLFSDNVEMLHNSFFACIIS